MLGIAQCCLLCIYGSAHEEEKFFSFGHFLIFIIKLFYLKSWTEHPCALGLGWIPKEELKQCQAVGREGGCSGRSSLHVWRGFSTAGKPKIYNSCYFFSLNGQIYIICSALSIQINVKICLNCSISPLLSMMQGNWCYVLNSHQLALALNSFTFLVLLQVSFTIPLKSPDIFSFGLLVCFLISNPSLQVYHSFSVWRVPTITLETTYF